MTALYFHALKPSDRMAVKPYAGPLPHAAHHLAGNQSRDQLQRCRAIGGMERYLSRTKDGIPVDFSAGSVGLGVAISFVASLLQIYLIAQGELAEANAGRMIALLGDAELDEGDIYECPIEAYRHDIRISWWIVDDDLHLLDATTAGRMFRRFDAIFVTCGWRVVTLKRGKLQQESFANSGGAALRDWVWACPNADYAARTYWGGAGWRTR